MEKTVFLKMPDMDANTLKLLREAMLKFDSMFCMASKEDEPEYVIAITTDKCLADNFSDYHFGAYEIQKEDFKKGSYSITGNGHLWPFNSPVIEK